MKINIEFNIYLNKQFMQNIIGQGNEINWFISFISF